MDIFQAIENNDIDRVKELLDSGVDVNIQDEYERTPLHEACDKNYIEIVKLLLAHPNIDVNVQDEYGKTSLSIACDENYIEIVKLLLKHPDIDVNTKNNIYGKTSLYLACLDNNIELVKLLLSHPDIDVNIQNEDDYGWTPLHQACHYDYIELVKLLLSHPDIDIDIDYNAVIEEEIWGFNDEIKVKYQFVYSPKVRSIFKHKNRDTLKNIISDIED